MATVRRLQTSPYMLAVGPPRSLICPLNQPLATRRATSCCTDCQTTGLDKLALMHGDGTERTAAKAAAVGGNGTLDLLKGRNLLSVTGVGFTTERQGIDGIQLVGAERQSRRIADHQTIAGCLHQTAGRSKGSVPAPSAGEHRQRRPCLLPAVPTRAADSADSRSLTRQQHRCPADHGWHQTIHRSASRWASSSRDRSPMP